MTENAQIENVRMKINSLENGRKVAHWNMTEKRHREKYIIYHIFILPFSGCVIFNIFQCVTFLSYSALCNICSFIFQVCIFCHIPVLVFSFIFSGVHFKVYYFPGCAFSSLSLSQSVFSIIFQCVRFPSFSMLYIFYFVIVLV